MKIMKDSEVHVLFIRVMLLCITFFVFVGGIFSYGIFSMKRSVVWQQEKVISGLLAEGVSATQIARAYQNNTADLKGKEYAAKMGYTEQMPIVYFSDYSISYIVQLVMLCLILLCFIVLLFLALQYFMKKKELCYHQARLCIDSYREGDYSRRLPQKDDGEMSALFASMNALSTQLKAGEENLAASKEFLKQTISDISHQLKTPIAAISMYQEIMTAEIDNTDVLKEFLKKTDKSLKRMEDLIYSLLKITRMDAGTVSFVYEKVELSELLSEACEDYVERAKVEHKNLVLQKKQGIYLNCDRGWMREAIGNLVKNALDHTEAMGEIVLSYEQTPNMLRILVRDNGQGIAEDDIYYIFKRFYRSRHSSDSQGAGLGLSLTKAIVEGMGGTISVNSKPKEGAAFTISFLTNL